MHALFFEVRPHPGHLAHYFEHVARLRPVLARHTGLSFLDRYASLADADVLLSHQLWDSEAAIAGWRCDAVHRESQAAGRQVHFADYRIRVGERVLHWQPDTPQATRETDRDYDAPHIVALYARQAVATPGFSSFESVNHPGQFIALSTMDGFVAANSLWDARSMQPGLDQAAVYRITRDYGLHDRAQAPR